MAKRAKPAATKSPVPTDRVIAWGDKNIFHAVREYMQNDAHIIDKQFVMHAGPDVAYVRHGVDPIAMTTHIDYKIGASLYQEMSDLLPMSMAARKIATDAKTRAEKLKR